MTQLKGKKTLVTGATAGIGREIAITFAKEGADVAIFGRNEERAKETLAAMEAVRAFPEQKFMCQLVDVASKESVDSGLVAVLEGFSSIDILVNNAGITRDGLLMKMSEEDFDAVIATNLKSLYNMCQPLIRPMLKARKGSIINISSVVGISGSAGQTNYASAKAGVIGFSKALAQEVASRGITVNCIAPGFIQTPMTDVLTEAQKEAILKNIPMAKLGECSDIAEAAVFLGTARYITGQVLVVDGGMVM